MVTPSPQLAAFVGVLLAGGSPAAAGETQPPTGIAGVRRPWPRRVEVTPPDDQTVNVRLDARFEVVVIEGDPEVPDAGTDQG